MQKHEKILNKWHIWPIINCGNLSLIILPVKKVKYRTWVLTNINQLKIEVHDTYVKNEKILTNFQPTDDGDVKNKAYLDEKIIKINGQLSLFEFQNNKQPVEEILIQRAVKTTLKLPYNRG